MKQLSNYSNLIANTMSEESDIIGDGVRDELPSPLLGDATPFSNLPGGEGGWLHQIVIFAAKEPWQFCWYVLLILSPMFCISAVLSWKLAQAIDAQEKDKNRKNKKRANLNKVKRGKAD